ncbi:hypothetical protein XENOCAPTIV_003119, partial [Xenoophorus captivus]
LQQTETEDGRRWRKWFEWSNAKYSLSNNHQPQTVSICADLTLGGERGLLVPQRKPTTFPRGTILIFTLAGGDVGVATTSKGSVVGMRSRQQISLQTSDKVH